MFYNYKSESLNLIINIVILANSALFTLFYEGYPIKLRQMRKIRIGIWLTLIFISVIFISIFSSSNPVAAQQAETATPTSPPPGTSFITVTYIEPINIRTGPSSFDYPVIGTLPVGGTATAIGRSPAGEWIEIEYEDAPRGTAWVYAANVSLSPGALLPIVEPPPTPAPLETNTPNPTFVAAFLEKPTSTRLPTFTAPPSLVVPTYANPARTSSNRALMAWVVVGLGGIGVVGLIATLFRRRY